MTAHLIPLSIRSDIESILYAPIVNAIPVQGGDISNSYKVELEDGQAFFLKCHKKNVETTRPMFAQEAKGLNTLRSASASTSTSLQIPEVIALNNSYLLLEYIEEQEHGNDFQFGVT